MEIRELEIHNFRCFEHLLIRFHPQVNLFVGKNGSGKSALLEALKLAVIGAIGEIKSAVPQKTTAAGYAIDTKKDPRISTFSLGEWVQSDAVEIRTTALIENTEMSWKRSLIKKNIKYGHINQFREIKSYTEKVFKGVIANEGIELPLFAYYSTGRLFLESKDTGVKVNGERLKGYTNAQTAKSSQYIFNEWFRKLEEGQYKYERHNIPFDFSFFEQVKNIICQFIPDCESILYDDIRYKEIILKFKDGKILPYSLLSDGVRNLVALISDLALRCAVLNPWKGKAINTTKGVVLIDEVDLHLHPGWQRIVVPGLLKIFPNVQFFLTTHSPLVLASAEPFAHDNLYNIFVLDGNKITGLENEMLGTANNWLTEVFELAEPRSVEGEKAIIKAKKLMEAGSPSLKDIQQVSKDLSGAVQAHDLFWIRWNHFANQKGVVI